MAAMTYLSMREDGARALILVLMSTRPMISGLIFFTLERLFGVSLI